MARIYLSPPHMGSDERSLLLEAFDSNWIAPLGPQVDAFEVEMCEYLDIGHGVALSSGTAGLELALLVLGVGPGDHVLVASLTFAATANAVRHVGAVPVFVDSEATSWNIDPDLIAQALDRDKKAGQRIRAIIAVDLYGQCADYERLVQVASAYRVPIIEDAAEALGATHGDKAAGTLGAIGVFSFNGNKIITTSGGGMMVSENPEWIARARHLASQARLPVTHYEHDAIGFNYRLSNLLAAVGRGQLRALHDRVKTRRAINAQYRHRLAGQAGFQFMPEAPWGRSTFWLTCLTIDPAVSGCDRDRIIAALGVREIEARPVWKPMHQQPIYRDCQMHGGQVADGLFERGLCLPSGSSLPASDVDRICDIIVETVVETASGGIS